MGAVGAGGGPGGGGGSGGGSREDDDLYPDISSYSEYISVERTYSVRRPVGVPQLILSHVS